MVVEEQDSPSPSERARPTESNKPPNPYEPDTNASTPPPHNHSRTRRLLHLPSPDGGSSHPRRRSVSGRRKAHNATVGGDSLTIQMHNATESKKANGDSTPRPGLGPRPIGGVEKLGMFSGVYVPTCLNVLSILMFLRFGFILGSCHFKPSPSWHS
jgi:potassium/chloride transporter 9